MRPAGPTPSPARACRWTLITGAEKNTIDDQTFGATQIDLPVNFAKGYTRGLEASLDGPLVPSVSYYANYARSWAKGAGPIIGGLLGEGADRLLL